MAALADEERVELMLQHQCSRNLCQPVSRLNYDSLQTSSRVPDPACSTNRIFYASQLRACSQMHQNTMPPPDAVVLAPVYWNTQVRDL